MRNAIRWEDLKFERLLGEGQAGSVWAARLLRPTREVAVGTVLAIKRYKRWVLEQPGQYERIYRELHAGTRVEHPNLVRAYCLVADPDGLPALVMKRYVGHSLERRLRSNTRAHTKGIPIDAAFQLIGRICSAVAALHEVGLVHRDIKPANVIVDRRWKPTLMDLGVVGVSDLAEGTTTADFLGTIRYAAPAYLFGDDHEPTFTDMYSIGVIAFELFTGEHHLGYTKNWATFIVDLSNFEQPEIRPDALQAIESRYGLNAAEAVRFVCEALFAYDSEALEEESVVRPFYSPRAVSEAIAAGIFTRPFHTPDDQIVLGSPPSVECMTSPRRRYSLNDAAIELRKLFRAAIYTKLRAAIRDWHWHPYINSQDPIWRQFERAGVVTPVGRTVLEMWKFHPTVHMVHRYNAWLPVH